MGVGAACPSPGGRGLPLALSPTQTPQSPRKGGHLGPDTTMDVHRMNAPLFPQILVPEGPELPHGRSRSRQVCQMPLPLPCPVPSSELSLQQSVHRAVCKPTWSKTRSPGRWPPLHLDPRTFPPPTPCDLHQQPSTQDLQLVPHPEDTSRGLWAPGLSTRVPVLLPVSASQTSFLPQTLLPATGHLHVLFPPSFLPLCPGPHLNVLMLTHHPFPPNALHCSQVAPCIVLIK